MSVGFRFVEREDSELYKRNRGMIEVQTNYRRATAANIPLMFLTAREIGDRIEHNRGRKVSLVFVRLHWSKSNAQPKR